IHLPFCESLCTFCGCHKRITKRHEVERPYITNVLTEWQRYCDLLPERPRITELHFGGGTPTFFSPENLTRLINGIFRTAHRAENYEFSFEGHPNNTTKEHLKALYDVGFRRVSYGVQDYNVEVQKAINRIQPFENVKNVTEWAREVGYTSVGHDIIFGLPFQTQAHVEETIMRTKELMPDRLAFYSYAHVPWLKGNGQRGFKESDLPSPDEKREQYGKGKEWLGEVGYCEIGMDHFALKSDSLYKAMETGSLHRNFMGYTASKTQVMIGLGASSISDSWDSFAQNVKSLEEYGHLVQNNMIPIYRGHILTDEDKVVRKHILNVMCRFITSGEDSEAVCRGLREAVGRLSALDSDGLLEIASERFVVTKKGRPFVRNICMAFDLLLHMHPPDTRLFSMTI